MSEGSLSSSMQVVVKSHPGVHGLGNSLYAAACHGGIPACRGGEERSNGKVHVHVGCICGSAVSEQLLLTRYVSWTSSVHSTATNW